MMLTRCKAVGCFREGCFFTTPINSLLASVFVAVRNRCGTVVYSSDSWCALFTSKLVTGSGCWERSSHAYRYCISPAFNFFVYLDYLMRDI